jgi:dTDP-L-rhamnose 4-epimerase
VKVLVTGGAGFIGSHIVDALLDEGAAVRVLDLSNPQAYLDPRAEFIPGDICDPVVVARAIEGVDTVCHQAAKVGLGADFGDVTGYVGANDAGTAVLLASLWRRSFRGRLVLASSMVVYGEGRGRCRQHGLVPVVPRSARDLAAGSFEPRCPSNHCRAPLAWVPVGEDAAFDPRNVYAATKVHQEHLCALWGRESGASVVALRFHNVYGPAWPSTLPTPAWRRSSPARWPRAGGRRCSRTEARRVTSCTSPTWLAPTCWR